MLPSRFAFSCAPGRQIGIYRDLSISHHDAVTIGRVPQTAQWWAHLVGAHRVHPHKHDANYPPQKDRGFARGARTDVRFTVSIAWWGSRSADFAEQGRDAR